MTFCRTRMARAPWVAMCLSACALAAFVRSSGAQDAGVISIPTSDPRAGTSKILPTAAETEAGIREVLRVDVTQGGSSTRGELADALKRLPMRQLSAEQARRVNAIVRSPSLFRRLPTITCRTDPRVYSYFVENPDVAVSIWRVMGISEMQVRQIGADEYETNLNDGTVGALTVLHRSERCHLVLCEGDFKSPLLAKPIRSTGLMCLQSRAWQDDGGRNYVTHTADLFVVFHSDAVEAIAKLISPMSFKMADRNFEEVTVFIRMMDEVMCHEPGWVERTAARMDGVIPGRDKELIEVAAQVYVDARRRALQRAGGPVSLDAILPPVQSASSRK